MKIFVSMATAGLLMALGACSTTPTDTAKTTPANTGGATGSAKASGTDGTSGQSSATLRASALPDGSALAKERSVFFAFDEAVIAPQYQGLIEKHGKYLAATPSLKVKIEGNADERGSAEYNLALGQRRAEATMKALKIWGVQESQMEAVSWGEERPSDKGADETAYSHNRRADIVYPKQ